MTNSNPLECRYVYCLYQADLEVLYGLSCLVCILVESSSDMRIVGKYVNNYFHNAASSLCENVVKKQVYLRP